MDTAPSATATTSACRRHSPALRGVRGGCARSLASAAARARVLPHAPRPTRLPLPRSACAIPLLVLFVFLFGGFFASTVTLASDICVDSTSALVSIARQYRDSPSAIDDMVAHATCNGDGLNQFNALSQARGSLTSARTAMSTTMAAAQPAGLFSGFPSLLTVNAFSTVEADWALASAALIAPLDSCGPLRVMVNDIIQPLCAVGTISLIKLWALSTAACIAVIVMAIAGARMMWHHPGDPHQEAAKTVAA